MSKNEVYWVYLNLYVTYKFNLHTYFILISKQSQGGVLILKETLLQEVAKRLKEAREKARLTIANVEENTDLSKGNISSWENAKFFPSSWALVQLSELYKVPIDWILKGTAIHSDAQTNSSAAPQKIEAVFDSDLKMMIDILKRLMECEDPDLRGWTKIQFRHAFGNLCASYEEEKKQA